MLAGTMIFQQRNFVLGQKFLPTEANPLTLATTLYAKTHQLKPKDDQCHIGRLKVVHDHIGRPKVDHDHVGRPKVEHDHDGRPKADQDC